MGNKRSVNWRSKVGLRFGGLTVLRDLGVSDKHETFYEVQCDCGTVRPMRSGQLHKAKSCGRGCIKRGTPKYDPHKSLLHRRFSDYKRGAKRRGLEFALTLEQVGNIIAGGCYFCGERPAGGIDRIDSTQGYFIGNVVQCCAVCNKMKLDTPIMQFLEHLARILAWQRQ